MAKKQKFDGVVEAVHYDPDGKVAWVRAYERRGPTFSDWILLPRQELINKIKSGKQYIGGDRISQMASTFNVTLPIQVLDSNGNEVLVSGSSQTGDHDHLDGVPII
jgi:hypothetical protein